MRVFFAAVVAAIVVVVVLMSAVLLVSGVAAVVVVIDVAFAVVGDIPLSFSVPSQLHKVTLTD